MTHFAVESAPHNTPLPSRPQAAPLPAPGPRVLLVLEATLGGALRYIQNLQEALAGAPLEIGFAYATERADHHLAPTLARARELGWSLFPVPMQRQVRPGSDLRALGVLAGVIRRFRPEIVHCHSSKAGALGRAAAVLGRAAALLVRPRPRVFYSPHALAPGVVYLRIEQMLAGWTDRFLAVSASERAQLGALGVSRLERTGVVYPVVDGAQFAPRSRAEARLALGLPPDRPMLVGVGRMVEQKCPLLFLEILVAVRRTMPNAFGVWVGGGELAGAFAARAAELELREDASVTGWVEDVRPYLAAANLAVSTSSFESFGYNLAEALAMERPAIGSDVCGTTDVLADAPATVLYTPGDAEEAAALAVGILRSPELAGQLGAAGRQSVLRRFSKDVMRAELLRNYTEALPSGRSEVPDRERVETLP